MANQQENKKENQPTGYRVEDDDNLEEKDLKRSALFGTGEMKKTTDRGMEGQGMGGETRPSAFARRFATAPPLPFNPDSVPAAPPN